jgi:hypothetical protein
VLSVHNGIKLQISNRKRTGKFQNRELNENEDIIFQNLLDMVESVLRGKCIALNSYIGKEKISKIKKLNFHLTGRKGKLNSN